MRPTEKAAKSVGKIAIAMAIVVATASLIIGNYGTAFIAAVWVIPIALLTTLLKKEVIKMPCPKKGKGGRGGGKRK